ncbi:hypothetical protein GOODEAATRI_024954 [Goodea atripinnis]|uniref:Uncharacterized protein n=1 Tax=Goodea atripinnis TaxID=208336 RepID=A0ABV0N467_9TELE
MISTEVTFRKYRITSSPVFNKNGTFTEEHRTVKMDFSKRNLHLKFCGAPGDPCSAWLAPDGPLLLDFHRANYPAVTTAVKLTLQRTRHPVRLFKINSPTEQHLS